ncbi:MAG: hypothetical protein K0S61_1268 [Anaerocolumna sp.]|nr:hypothetical protein [Anaerocolumna sp.]
MKDWILFVLFLFVGLVMLFSGIFYMRKEKDNTESVKLYRNISILGAILAIAAVLMKFVF